MDVNLNSASISQCDSKERGLNDTVDRPIALPLHLQHLESALSIDSFVRQVQSIVTTSSRGVNNETSINVSKQQLKTVKTRLYNLSKVKKTKKWIKDILLDRSDSSDSDFEMKLDAQDSLQLYSDSVHDMIKYENLKRKFTKRKESKCTKDELVGKRTLKFRSSDLLGTNFDFKTQSSSKSSFNEEVASHDSSNGPVSTSGKNKKSKNSASINIKAPVSKKKAILPRTTPSPSPSTPTANCSVGVKENGSLDKAIISNVSSKNVATVVAKAPQVSPPGSTSIRIASNSVNEKDAMKPEACPVAIAASQTVDLNSTCIISNSKQLNSLLSLDSVDSMRYKERLLDEIPYDMTLPDEILQTESSLSQCDAMVTVSRSLVNEEIVYNANLPDEIFDTEESNTSVISQSLSSPSPSMSLYNPSSSVKINSAIARPVTAPSTPTGLSSSHTTTGKGRKSKPLLPRCNLGKSDQPLSSSSSSLATASPDSTDAMKRKKVWMFIVQHEIVKNHTQLVATKASNCTMRKSLADTCKNNHFRLITKWYSPSQPHRTNETLTEEIFQFWSKEAASGMLL